MGTVETYIATRDEIAEAREKNVADLSARVYQLRAKLAEIRGHLGACVMQRAPTDDAIIFEHIEAALAAARE